MSGTRGDLSRKVASLPSVAGCFATGCVFVVFISNHSAPWALFHASAICPLGHTLRKPMTGQPFFERMSDSSDTYRIIFFSFIMRETGSESRDGDGVLFLRCYMIEHMRRRICSFDHLLALKFYRHHGFIFYENGR